MIKPLIKKLLAQAGLGIYRVRGCYDQDGLFTVHSDHFRRDPAFRAAYRRGVQASRGVEPAIEWRVHVALWAAETALQADGDFVECGVNAGFISSAIMERLHWNTRRRRFFLIDTFTGPVLEDYSPTEAAQDRILIAQRALAAGAFVTDMERVRANFAEWGDAVIVQGAVPQVLKNVEFGPVAFLHIDMNCALPELAAFEFFWERLAPGAVVLFDDYCYYGHDSQRVALDAAARQWGATILSLPTGQGLVIKR